MIVFNAVTTFFVDAFPGKSASATAVSNFIRNLFAAIASLVANIILDSIGPGWLSVLIAGLNWVGVGFVCLVIWYGEEWREMAGLVPATATAGNVTEMTVKTKK